MKIKTIILFLFLLLFISPCIAQSENCGLNSPPDLLGLRLNMSPEQAQSVFGRELKISVKTDDERNIFQNYIEKPAPPVLNGVRALFLRFYNRKLYQIEVFYEETPNIKTLQDFIGWLSAKLNIPPSDWREEKRKALINCGEFTIAADKILNPHIEITDEAGRAQVEAAREKKGKKK